MDKERILALLCEETDTPHITPGMRLKEDLGITSFQMLSFVTRLNGVLGIAVPMAKILSWQTVADILETEELVG